MTLREGANIVLGRIYGGFVPADAKISERRVMMEILIQRDTVVQNELRKSNGLWEMTPEMFVVYGGSIDPVEDADESLWIVPQFSNFLGMYYIELPSPPLPLQNDRGIDQIYPIGHPELSYVRIDNAMETLAYSVSQGMEGNLTWKLSPQKNNRIVELPNMVASKLPTRLAVEMIPTSQAAMFEKIGAGDRISLPGAFLGDTPEEQRDGILTKAYKILLTLDNRQDSANDNLDKK
jgi:hypothetical protein